jgi:hypothetical protein
VLIQDQSTTLWRLRNEGKASRIVNERWSTIPNKMTGRRDGRVVDGGGLENH